jgi:putative endonuclease
MNQDKRFVYVLRSDRNPRRHYVGLTSDVQTRLDWHNAGQNEHTVRDRPWHVLVSLEFRTAEAAGQFERYLKTGSGRAFAKRHFP